MKSIASIILFMLGASLHAQPTPQPMPRFFGGGADQPGLIEWQGLPQRTYLMQWSTDLTQWNFFPLTEEGAGAKNFGTFSSTPKFFTRLHYTDEVPDLAKGGVWQPPLLRVAGMWQVQLTTSSGLPASGVGLSFFRWNAGATAPQTFPFFYGVSGQDGSCSIDPGSFSPALAVGDRVEVRLTGSPNQRVYLPWNAGGVLGDAAFSSGFLGSVIKPGGTPLTLGNVGNDNQFEAIPNVGSMPPESEALPVYRFHDFLTVRRSNNQQWGDQHAGKSYLQYPSIAEKKLLEEVTSANGMISSPARDSSSDTKLWNEEIYKNMGWFLFEEPHLPGEQFAEEPYELDLSLTFSDAGYQRPVKCHVLTHYKSHPFIFSEYRAAVSPANTPFLFKNGSIRHMGQDEYPYASPSDLSTSLRYKRQLVLGPVPMFVPESVMGGEPFFYSNINDVVLHAELPFGGLFDSVYERINESSHEIITQKLQIEWNATVLGTNRVHVEVRASDEGDVMQSGEKNISSTVQQPSPMCEIKFSQANPLVTNVNTNFEVKVVAKAIINRTENGIPTIVEYELGDFTTDFKYSAPPSATDPLLTFAKRQTAELRGLGDHIPEGHVLLGGQRSKTLEPERKIGVTGKPSPEANTFVDSLTGRFHHTESDFSLAVPGSDLTLGITRQAAESVWSNSFGLRPAENPLLPFGAGWNSNLAASLTRSVAVTPEGIEYSANLEDPRRFVSSITVRDYQGRAFTFLEYTNSANVTNFLPDPTLVPGRDTSNISLSRAANGSYTFTQPMLGITHKYAASTANILVPNNRNIPNNGSVQPGGYARHDFHRLERVIDRYDVQLEYQYNGPHSLIPERISVAGRHELRLGIRQENGRVTHFWDPNGVKHTYSHQSHNFAALGQPAAMHHVLASHTIGSRIDANYDYTYVIEADPRPTAMLAALQNTTGNYRIPTHHLALKSITRGDQETLTIHYTTSQVRSAWSSAAAAYYHPAGDPLIVDKIILPNNTEVDFTCLHTLKNGHPAVPAAAGQPAIPAASMQNEITTKVTDFHGSHWTYAYATPSTYAWQLPQADAVHLPSASALFFPSLTRTCDDIADSSVTFHYDARAGYALAASTDAAGRGTTATYEFAVPAATPAAATPYSRPLTTAATPIHSYYPVPTTTTNLLGHTTNYHYTTDLLPSQIIDSRDRRITFHRDSLARLTSLTVHQGENQLLAQIDHAHTNAALPGAVTRITKKALNHPTDPAWVTDLITDVHYDDLGFPEFIGNDAAALFHHNVHSPSGLILESRTPDGATTTFSYDAAAQLTHTTLADGTSHQYEYDSAGRLTLSRDPIGNAIGYQYDSLSRPTKSIRDMNGDLAYSPTSGLTGIQPTQDIITTTSHQDATRSLRHTDPRGFISEFRFDALSRLTTKITPSPTTPPGTVPTIANDYVTHLEYDILENPSQPTKITDPRGYATHYHYDAFARIELILSEYATDSTTATTATKLHSGLSYAYSPTTGLPESITTYRSPCDAEGNLLDAFAATLTEQINYDLLDRPQQSIHARGTDKEQITRHGYTSTGLPYLTESRITTTPSEQWAAYTTEYDALARITKQILPTVTDATTSTLANPTTAIHYDATGRIESTSDAYNHQTHYGYDALGRLSWQKQPTVLDARSGQYARPTTIYFYDARGQNTKTIDPLGYAWHTGYDAAGRTTSRTSPILRPELPTAQQRATTRYYYDLASNLSEIIDANGHATTHTHRPDGLPLTTTIRPATPSANFIPYTTSFTHDAQGNLTQLTDPAQQITALTYDGLSRTLTTTRDPSTAIPSRQKTETTHYDALLPTAHIDAANQRREYHYDAQFRLRELHHIGHSAENLHFTHDAQGRLTHITPLTAPTDPSTLATHGDPTITHSYDILGRRTSETSNTITTHYTYDLLHQLKTTTTQAPATSPTSQPLTLHTSSYTYDPARRLTSTTSTTYPLLAAHTTQVTSYQHNLRGEVINEIYPNGLTQTNTLDPAGRLIAQTIRPHNSPQHHTRSEYQYDHLSNLTRLQETFAPGLNIPNRTLNNTYDHRNQLRTESQVESGGPLGTTTRTRSETHTYDPAENRLTTHIHSNDRSSASTLARIFTYGSPTNGYNANQLHTLTETTNNGTPLSTHFTYDDNGNRRSKTTGSATDHYHYDIHNRLTKLEVNTAAVTSENGIYHYRYDPQNRRITRSIGTTPTAATTTNFAFNGHSPIHQWQGRASAPSTTHQRQGNHHTTVVNPQLYSHTTTTTQDVKNVRHDITAQFNGLGTLQWHGQYASNGMLLRQYGSKTSSYGANGKYEEPNGLLNEGHRYRDRLTNTFLTRDPLGYIDGPNNYNYVRHNPWSAWDPLGLSTDYLNTTDDIGYQSWADRNFGLHVTTYSDDRNQRFRKNSSGDWEVRLVTYNLGLCRDKRYFVGAEWVSADSQRFRLSGFKEYNEQGGVTTDGSNFIAATMQETGRDHNAYKEGTILAPTAMVAQVAIPIIFVYGTPVVVGAASTNTQIEASLLLQSTGRWVWSYSGVRAVTYAGGGIFGASAAHTLITDEYTRSDFFGSWLSDPYHAESAGILAYAGYRGMSHAGTAISRSFSSNTSYFNYRNWRINPTQFNSGLQFPEFRPQQIAANSLTPGSLSNKATRDWYIESVTGIGKTLNPNASLREQALDAFTKRTNIRTQARSLMSDRKLAESLPDMPSLSDIVRRKYDKGLVGDDLWRDVIRSAQTPNSNVNKLFGIE